MRHEVYFNVPARKLGNTDLMIWIYAGKRKKWSSGRLRISKGTLDFIPGRGKKPLKVGWDHVEEMFKEYYYGDSVRKR